LTATWRDYVGLGLALIVLVFAFGVLTEHFFARATFATIANQIPAALLVAVGMTFVLIVGGIDLSVGSVVGLAGVLCADALVRGAGLPAGVAVGLVVGLVVGTVNGLAVTQLRVPPFIVTLAMMLIVRGAAYKYTNARTISGLPPAFGALSQGALAASVMAAVFALTWVLLMRTPFGRHVYATGGNPEAAWLAGIRVQRVLLAVYALCGLCAGLAGVLVASRLNAGYPKAGEFYELDAVTAVVVGGTSLFGGRGSIWGTLAGAFFIGILNNGLNLFHVETYDQLMVKGAVLLAAASLDRWRASSA